MSVIVKKHGAPSPFALAFAAALAAAPAAAPSAKTAAPATATAQGGAQVVPSAAALERMATLSAILIGPRWVELWPEVVHVEAVKR